MKKKASYKEMGLVNTREMFKKAMAGGYAIPAYNFNSLEQLQAIVMGCAESYSPFILQVSPGARRYTDPVLLCRMVQGASEMLMNIGSRLRFALHLDHGDSFDLCRSCIESGFSSVMIDGSALPFEDNIKLTIKVVEYARLWNVSVEGELGIIAGIEDDAQAAKSIYTRPEDVEEFLKVTGVDSLAISIGTSHGAYKFKPNQCTRNVMGILEPPPLRFDILEEIERRIPGFPIVLHGASSVVRKYVDMINRFGGRLEDAVGIPEDQLRRAARSAVCKINIDSDCRLAMTGLVRKILAENPQEFDPRKFLGPARDELKAMIIEKNTNVLGSAGRGKEIFG